MLAGVLEFQRDMISENTREGVAAAEAAGKILGRPAAPDDTPGREGGAGPPRGAAIKALARAYGVSPKTIRRVLSAADIRDARSSAAQPDPATAETEDRRQAPDPEPEKPHTIDIPGLLAEHLKGTRTPPLVRPCAAGGPSAANRGYSVRITVPLAIHQAVLDQCAAGSRPRRPHSRPRYRAKGRRGRPSRRAKGSVMCHRPSAAQA